MQSFFVAFLRGVNVGGKTRISMDKLKKIMEAEGFSHVRTLLNSGNIIFEAENSGIDAKTVLENLIEQTFHFHSDIIIRSRNEIEHLVHRDPFRKIPLSENTRLYTTFFSDPPANIPLPDFSAGKECTLVSISKTEVCWSVEVSVGYGTTEAMKFLEKTFGKNITTRNWNTVIKIAKELQIV